MGNQVCVCVLVLVKKKKKEHVILRSLKNVGPDESKRKHRDFSNICPRLEDINNYINALHCCIHWLFDLTHMGFQLGSIWSYYSAAPLCSMFSKEYTHEVRNYTQRADDRSKNSCFHADLIHTGSKHGCRENNGGWGGRRAGLQITWVDGRREKEKTVNN